MYKYDGLVIHQCFDELGVIEIVESNGVRSLHFGTSARQSSMLASDPYFLNSLYARTMMAGLLFHAEPHQVLMIGLGGGELAKFLLHQFPDCRIKAIEFRSSVLKVARSHFHLPFDARLKVKIGCGAQHAEQESLTKSHCYDLMLIDAYGETGMAPEVSSQAFFDHCRALLTKDGLLAINLWGSDKKMFQQVHWHLGRSFNQRLLFLPVRSRGNIIGFAFGEHAPLFTLQQLSEKADQLERRFHLDFATYLQDLKRHNAAGLKRVIKI
jgi:spermidine synthase